MLRSFGADLSGGLENIPVLIESGVSQDALSKLQYTPENVQGPGCDVDPSEVTLPGCVCRAQSCVPDGCPCLCFGQAYTSEGRLVERQADEADLLHSQPVFECNVLCECSESCQSRLVQNGLRVQLGVFRTQDRGWGVLALEPIPRGCFVCEYAGEVIGFQEARRRQLSQTSSDMNYIISVREHGGERRFIQTFVDPASVGNVGRFLNHSCQPNLVMLPVRVHSLAPRLALFASRDVEVGEELMFDYSGGHDSNTQTQMDAGASQKKPCHCGAPNCTGFLPLDISVLC
ncbi:histone-lysine N-methyltransferase SETMAR [Astyanax mexicanus]|uniref:histone-lysine N-methyltransferase SETMAR n=1 Tax=Astyanax mexicanus TaxID=7994 RepID=UPI0020CB202F|nr:histone-lysine N-methyltransferase SETMAR [Astyanax mexicanus]